MRVELVFTLLAILPLFANDARAQCGTPSATDVITIEITECTPAATIAVRADTHVRLTHVDPLAGFSFGVAHDPTYTTAQDVLPGADLKVLNGGLGPDVWLVDLSPSGGIGLTVNAIVSTLGTETIPPGVDQHVAVLYYDVLGAPEGEVIALDFTCDLGVPPVETRLDTGTGFVHPQAVPGAVVSHVFGCDGEALHEEWQLAAGQVVTASGVEVEVPITGSVPDAIIGFSASITHDPAVATAVAVEAGVDLLALNGGAGPEFFAPAQFPDGQTIGCVFSLMPPFDLLRAGTHELIVCRYAVDPTVTPGSASPIEFACVPNVPPGTVAVPTLFLEEANVVERFPMLVPGLIQVEGSFLRGDTNGDGAFDGLVDGVYSLLFQFAQGQAPPCMESADVDGDGDFNGLSDSIFLLVHQFTGGTPPPAPYPECGADPDPATSLGCDQSDCP